MSVRTEQDLYKIDARLIKGDNLTLFKARSGALDWITWISLYIYDNETSQNKIQFQHEVIIVGQVAD